MLLFAVACAFIAAYFSDRDRRLIRYAFRHVETRCRADRKPNLKVYTHGVFEIKERRSSWRGGENVRSAGNPAKEVNP